MDLRGFTACAIIALCLIKQSDAQITGWTETGFTVSSGTTTKDVTMVYDTAVSESTVAGSKMFSLTAAPTAGGAAVTYAFSATGNPDSIGDIVTTTNVATINLATGKTLNYDTTASYQFTVIATEASHATLGTAIVTINIGMAFAKGQYGACIVDGSSAGTVVGTYALENVASGTTVTYSITDGNTNTEFTIGGTTGQISLDTGKTVAQTTLGGYTLDIKGTVGTVDHDTAKVWIAVADSCGSGAVQIAAALGIIIASFATMHFV